MTSNIRDELKKMRSTGARGTTIRAHRSLYVPHLKPMAVLSMFVIPVLFYYGLFALQDWITAYWGDIIDLWVRWGGLTGKLEWAKANFLFTTVSLPYPLIESTQPTGMGLIITTGLALVTMIVSYLLPERFLPGIYLLRAAIVILLSSVFFFALWPNTFHYTVSNYVLDALLQSLHFLYLIPAMLALIYYIFDIGFFKKIALTAIMLLYFILALPFQFMLHAYVIQATSLVAMPVLYMLFGLLLDVMLFVALYAWGMSWKMRES